MSNLALEFKRHFDKGYFITWMKGEVGVLDRVL